MDAANTLSTLVIAAGFVGALIWSARAAFGSAGWRRLVHVLNVVLMVAVGLSVVTGYSGPAVLGGGVLLVTTLLVARGHTSDPYRWLVMVQFVFALFVASGAPFRHG
ncbi:MAG: hypothetical protein ABI459_09660 [Deltaproteobacteria bacterium]